MNRDAGAGRTFGSTRLLGVLVAVALVVGLGALGFAVVLSGDEDPAAEGDRFTQTWQRSYTVTTCESWGSAMTAEQRFAGAAELLASERETVDGDPGDPASDELIERFEEDISTVCERDAAAKLTEAAFTAYDEDPSYRP